MQLRCRTEAYGLFAACLPQQARELVDALPARQRKRQGMVPDFVVSLPRDGSDAEAEYLFELKTLHVGATTYPLGLQERCAAVAKRAEALPAQYVAHARRLDRRYCGTTEGHVGPVEERLRRFDGVRGLVFGAWGEASPDVEGFLHACAESGARWHWRAMRAAQPHGAQALLVGLLRRRWGLTACREAARLTLDRLALLGGGAPEAEARRRAGRDRAAAAQRVAAWQLRAERVRARRGCFL